MQNPESGTCTIEEQNHEQRSKKSLVESGKPKKPSTNRWVISTNPCVEYDRNGISALPKPHFSATRHYRHVLYVARATFP